MQFQDRFATLTSVVDDSRSDLDAALKNLSDVVGETTRFIEGTRDKTAEQIQRLSNVTQNLADHRLALENVLHIAPHSIANAVNMFDPRTGAASGVFVLNNMSNPVWFVCGMIGALENVTAPETGKLCAQYLGPGLRLANFNNLPFPVSLFLSSNPPPYMLRYSEPELMPGAAGPEPGPPETPPAVSAYTGMGDVPPPPGYGPPPGPPPASGPCTAGPTDIAGHAVTGRRPAMMGRRLLTVFAAVMLVLTGCAFQGVNSLPLPGAVGRGADAAVYHVEMANIGTLESNSPVMIDDVVVGSVGKMTLHGWHVDLEVSVKPDVVVPANAVATVGQTSLLGSMHVALDPSPGQAPGGRLPPGTTIGLNDSSTYPSTEQTLSSLAAVVNGGGLGQIGEIIGNFNTALSGRQDAVRDLITRLDTLAGTLYQQRDNIIATIDELNRFALRLGSQQEILTRALNKIPPALDVLLEERPRLTTALTKAGRVQ